VLDPIDRISEILFGLIMALTFTVGIDAVATDGVEVRSLLVAAIGCNIAWGLVDGVMFVSMGLVERARGIHLLSALQREDPAVGGARLRAELSEGVADALDDRTMEELRRAVVALPPIPAPTLRREDWHGAVAVALLVFLSTFPVVVPFMIVDDARIALRISNAVAIAMLFGCGWALGRYAGGRPWRVGLSMAVLGSVLVPVTVALGG
jgi:hypothetical protein